MADDVPGLPGFKSYSTKPKTSGDTTPTATPSAPASTGEVPGLPGYKSVAGQGKPPPPAQPDPNAYQPPDWIPGAGFLYKTNRIFENALTSGAADYVTSKAGELARRFGISNTTPSVPQLRAETAQDRKDVGPVASAVADVAGYGMGPGKLLGPLAGRLAPVAGRYGAAAVEGAAANAADVAGTHLGSDQPLNYWDTGKKIVAGGLTGIGGQAAGDVATAALRPLANWRQGYPGRGREQWDWRRRAAAGEDVRPDIQNWWESLPPSAQTSEKSAAIDRTINTLGQSTEPGPVAHATQTAAGAALSQLGIPLEGINQAAELTGLGAAGGGASVLGWNPAARAVNRIDRNINVGQSLDQLYPALTGNQMSIDTSRWADALRQLTIGSQVTPTQTP